MKTIITHIAFLLSATVAFSQNFTTNNIVGAWENNSTWVGNSQPSLGSVNNQNIFIYGTITRNGNITLRNNNKITVNSGDTLVVTGDFILNNNSDVIIDENGVFMVFGDFESNNNLDIKTGGIVAILGDFTTNSADVNIEAGGGMFVFGNSSIDLETYGISTGEDFILGQPDLVSWLEDEYDLDLPIELESFTVSYTNNTIYANWVTASETNNHYFTLEYSTDGVTFSELAEILGSGTKSTRTEYSYSTSNPANHGIVYFRLKQTDYDASYSYSHIVALEIEPKISIDLYPNPATDYIYINTTEEITNLTLVHTQSQRVTIPEISQVISLEQVPVGVYVLVIETETSTVTKQFIKR